VLDGLLVPFSVAVVLGAAGLIIPGAAIYTLRRKAWRRIRYGGTDILIEGGPI
jgi:hypothetical protein